MGEVSLIRIDDRLIHGQVTTAWLRYFTANKIVIANSRIAVDPTYEMIFSVAQIPGKEIILLSPQDTVKSIQETGPKDKFFIISPSPMDIIELMDAGLTVKKINIGGLQSRPGTQKLAKVVFALKEEVSAFKELAARGVEMEVQMVPTDRVAHLKLK